MPQRLGARADRQLPSLRPVALAPPVSSPSFPPPPQSGWRFYLPNRRGPSLAGSPCLGLGGTPRWELAPRVAPPLGTGCPGGASSGKALLEENAIPAVCRPGPWWPLPGERWRDGAGRTPGRKAVGRGPPRACARVLGGSAGSLSLPRGFAEKPKSNIAVEPGQRWRGGRRPQGPPRAHSTSPTPCGALGAPGRACRAPETSASAGVSSRRCPASAAPRPLHRHHPDAISESDSRSGLGPRRSPPRPTTVTSASLGRAGVPAGAPSSHRQRSSGPGVVKCEGSPEHTARRSAEAAGQKPPAARP